MSFFSCAVFFSVLLVNVLRGSDDVALALRGSDESAYLQAVLRDIGLDGDARARAVFLQNLQSPDTTYIDNRIGVYFKTRQLDPAYTVPLMRAQALLQLRQKTSHANKTKNDDALCRQAVYYGVVPALDAVSRYYGDAGNAASSFAVMKKAHFWRTFGSFCGVRQGIGDSSGTHEQALDTLIKLAPHVVSENSDRVYRATIRPVVSELAKKAYAGDMNACLRLFNLSGMSGIKVQECVVNAMKCVFEAHVDDAACLQFISAHDLEKTLQITAQCGDKRACGLLGRLFFWTKAIRRCSDRIWPR